MKVKMGIVVLEDCTICGKKLKEGSKFDCYVYDSVTDCDKTGGIMSLVPFENNNFKRSEINEAEKKGLIEVER